MKNFYPQSFLLLLFTAFATLNLQAQCPGCQIDTQCGVGINPVAPTLCPPTLPNGVQGQPYDQDLTFFMPRNFTDQGTGVDVTLNEITVTSIVGIPQGLTYECNNPGCNYTVTNDPLTQRGCVKICGTPTVPGNYNIVVNVVANVTTPVGTINQPSSFTLPLVVDPAPGGNPLFGFNPPSACGSLDVTYEAYLNFAPDQETVYSWDFDNGDTSDLQYPPIQHYDTAGTYYPSLTTTVYNYVLTDVTVTASGSNWCGDVEEISLFGVCQGAPDIYFTFNSQTQSYTSSAGSNNLSNSWSNLDLLLGTPPFSIQFWDSDGTSADDDLGLYPAYVTGPGTFNYTTPESFGTYTISLVVDTVYSITDTVVVFANPPTPVITPLVNDSVCLGDSILLTSVSGPYQYQWFQSETFISDSEAVWVSEPGPTGYYNLLITDTTTFCNAMADSIAVTFVNAPPAPVVTYNPSTDALEITNNNNGAFSVQWFNNGVEVQGETTNSLAGQMTEGPYTVVFTNSIGCQNTSFPFTLCLSGAVSGVSGDTVCCGDLSNLLATDFVTSQGFNVAWGVTPTSFGPITSQEDAQAANDLGYVYGGTTDTTFDFLRTCPSLNDSLTEGWYYITPFIAEQFDVTPLPWDTLTHDCRPFMEICPIITGDSGWAIDPLIFTFPDGSQYNVNDEYAPPVHLVITEGLIEALPGGVLPCIPLTEIFPGDPNGTWLLSATNIGYESVNVELPAFQIIAYGDTCGLITEDIVYTLDPINLTLDPGESQTVSIQVPPLPGDFPSIDPSCRGFGEPDSVYLMNCFPELTCNLTIEFIQSQDASAFGASDGVIDVEIYGGAPPYDISWSNGGDTEDLIGLPAGDYTLTVTDGNGCSRTGTYTISQPTGINETEGNGFALMQNIPNPFAESTTISFAATTPGDYNFMITTIEGKIVENRKVEAIAGLNKIEFFTGDLSAGVYFYTITNGSVGATKKMMIKK